MKHILLDVRSELQFQMISLPIEKYNTIDLNSINYVNIPYSNLKNNSKIHQDNLQSKVLSVAEISKSKRIVLFCFFLSFYNLYLIIILNLIFR